MDRTELQNLMQLPGSFRPSSADSPQYQWLIDSIVSGLSLVTDDTNALLKMMSLTNASSTWLDIWGQIYGIPRMDAEDDADYRTRIIFSISAQHVTGAAILEFIQSQGIPASLPAASGIGYDIYISTSLGQTKITNLGASLALVRPTGVPFKLYINSLLATTLHSVNYVGDDNIVGSYLGGGAPVLQQLHLKDYYILPPNTLPMILRTDPIITGRSPL